MLNVTGKTLLVAVLVLACLAAGAEAVKSVANPPKANALENLTRAYQFEVSGQLRYAAYARKAEQEGQMAAATHFWLMSSTEGLHARAVAKLIKRSGGKLETGISIPAVKSTKENLQAAARMESADAESLWRDYLHQAQQAANDTTDYDKFDIETQCPAKVKAAPEVRLFLMLKTVDATYAARSAEELKRLEESPEGLMCFLAPAGLKMRKQGLKLLEKYGVS